MATGDILSITIRPDGFSADVVFSAFNTGGTYAFGLGTNNDPTNAKFVLTTTSPGYTNGSLVSNKTKTIYGVPDRNVGAVRLPYPNQANPNEVYSSPNLTVRIALSDFICSTDTAVIANIASGFLTYNSTPSNTLTNLTCTNNSVRTYTECPVIARWDNVAGVMTRDRVQAAFYMAANAVHRHGIDCVVFTATGATSSHVETVTVSSRTTEQYTATSIYRELYKSTAIPLTNFTQGELITLRMQVYPLIGDANAVLDTNSNTTATNEILGYNQAIITCDKSAALNNYAFVDVSSGNDSTGVCSTTLATAQASPYATIGKANQGGANIIYLNAGTHNIVGSAPSSNITATEWRIVQPAPSATKATAIVNLDTVKTYNCTRMMFKNLTVGINSTSCWLNGNNVANFVRFYGCTFSHGSIGTPTTGIGYASYGCYLQNCDGDLSNTNWSLTGFSTARVAYSYEGVSFNETNTNITQTATMVMIGCLMAGYGIGMYEKASGNPAPISDGTFYAWNKWYKVVGGQSALQRGNSNVITKGLAIISNIIEQCTSTSTAALLGIALDSTAVNCHNVLLWHNIVVGDRTNLGYNETGTTVYDRYHWSQVGNIFSYWNNKGDVFASNGNLIGNWPVNYNVGTKGCLHYTDSGSGSFRGAFDGLYTLWGTAPTFTNDQSRSGGNAGNGVYTPLSSSPQIGLVKSSFKVLNYDIDGNTRGANTAAGAYAVSAEYAVTYTNTYNGNGNTSGSVPTDGSSPYASGATVTVLSNSGSLVKTGYSFNNWNTAENGSGIAYAPSDTFSITTNTTLYAQWLSNPIYPAKTIVVGGQGTRADKSDNNGGAYSSDISYANFQGANGGPLYSVTGASYDTATGKITKTGAFATGLKGCWALVIDGASGGWVRKRYWIQDSSANDIYIGTGIGSNANLNVYVGGSLSTYTEAESTATGILDGDTLANEIPNGAYIVNGKSITLQNPASSGGGSIFGGSIIH